jgi:hypothetical protein
MKPIASGYVFQVSKKTFWCRLETNDHQIIDAQIEIDKIAEKERPLLSTGAYMHILKGGSIRFIRLRWSKKEIEDAQRRASNLLNTTYD